MRFLARDQARPRLYREARFGALLDAAPSSLGRLNYLVSSSRGMRTSELQGPLRGGSFCGAAINCACRFSSIEAGK